MPSETVSLLKDDRVAVVTVDNPPVNALSHAVRSGVWEAVHAAAGDASVDAVVLTCAGRTFIAGADIKEFGLPPQPPILPELIGAIEAVDKPVVAAIHGTALGGGFELALGCHFRVGLKGAQVGLPEVKLGMIPGAGGTQRLPRLIGPLAALKPIVTGEPIPAEEARALGILDALFESDLVENAVAFARQAVREKRALRRASRSTEALEAARADTQAFDAAAQRLLARARGLKAPAACVEAVRDTLSLSFEQGMKRARETFLALRDGEESKAQRHLFFAERAALKIPGVPKGTEKRRIERVAVLGAGTMGAGITMSFATAGIPVSMIDPNAEALERGLATIRRNYAGTVKRGGMDEAAAEAAMGRIAPADDLGPAGEADLVVEAVFEDMDLKKKVFADLGARAKPGAILATNTSYLDVDEIAAASGRPGDVLGMHFFSPANVMRLLEIVRAREAAPDVLASAVEIGRRIGKVPVVVGVCYGFVGNRMLAARSAEVERLLLEGATPQAIDAAATAFGFAMGPCAVSDLAGLDVGWRARKAAGRKAPVADAICELGRFGQKTGRGYYRYEEGSRKPVPDPEIEALIAGISKEMGIARRAIDAEEITERLVFPLINEGARILEEKIAARAGDIDLIWVNGYGWPVAKGGPMYHADRIGPGRVAERLTAYAQASGQEGLRPAPLLARLAAEGGRFADVGEGG